MQGMLMEFSPVSTAIFWLNLLWRDICIRLLENELGEVTLTLGRFFFLAGFIGNFFTLLYPRSHFCDLEILKEKLI